MHIKRRLNRRIRKLKIVRFLKIVPFQKELLLQRSSENPIIKPNADNRWESEAVFNTGTVLLENKVHFIYRAIGESGASVFGYASSSDGIQLDERLEIPAFVSEQLSPEEKYPAHPYATQSGGSYYGSEDPRLTAIDDTLYMTYTAFDGCSPPRVALSSIKISDFLNKEWNWSRPKFISPPGDTNKNWVIFPEKINGKYAVLHSISPKVSIAYLDSLDFSDGTYINSYYCSGGRDAHWDNWVRGVGPPPVKTREGWLVLYHAMDKNDPGKYKLGALLLDSREPEKVLYRSGFPLLEPTQWYENEGHKRGVIYSCGTAIIQEKLFVYYGGSDSFICAATGSMEKLRELFKSASPHKTRK